MCHSDTRHHLNSQYKIMNLGTTAIFLFIFFIFIFFLIPRIAFYHILQHAGDDGRCLCPVLSFPERHGGDAVPDRGLLVGSRSDSLRYKIPQSI